MLDETTEAIEKLESEVEELSEDFSGEAIGLWDDVKMHFSDVKDKLRTASKDQEMSNNAQLHAHLGAMEAHDKMSGIKDTVEVFTNKVSEKSQAEVDAAALRAHLAKIEAGDFWKKKGKKMSSDFNESSDKVREQAFEAVLGVKDYFEKLIGLFSKKG